MTLDQWLEGLRGGIAGIGRTPVEQLDRDAPTCPGWTVRDVIAHTGAVHRWAAGNIVGQKVPFSESDAPTDGAIIAWYGDQAAALIAALASTPADAPTKSVFGERPVSFWYRRQAHEVTVHRWDVEHAYRGWEADPIDGELAADGIAEWATLMAPRFAGKTPQSLHGTRIGLVGEAGSWTLAVQESAIEFIDGDVAEADVTLAGSASDLLLAVWNRVPLSRLTVTGDVERAQQLLELIRV